MSQTVEAQEDVFAVAYGDEVHVYPAAREQDAQSLFLVGVAGFGDGDIRRVGADRWEAAQKKLHSMGIKVVTHR